VTEYERVIPWLVLVRYPPAGLEPAYDRVRLNIGVTDVDDPGLKEPAKYIELAPTLFPYTYAYLKQSLFPLVVLPEEGW
jgi:hypothetical protein